MKTNILTPIGTALIVAAIATYMICFSGSEMLLTIFLVVVLSLALLMVCGWSERHDILFWLFFFAMIISASSISYETTAGTGGLNYLDLPVSIMITVTIKYVLLMTVLMSGIFLLPDLFQKQ
jgi:hypothetical protein